jgi:phage terminase large subunit
VYWIDKYCYTYDPRTVAKALPFKLWPKQVEFIRWIQEREEAFRKTGIDEEGLCEKSRDAGVTFLCAAYALHHWLFEPGYAVGFGSHKLEYVDKLGDPKCIFEKIRFMLRRLPPDMLPKGFKWNTDSKRSTLINPENGATITGEGGDDIGRGGRTALYFIDEAAFIERADNIEASLLGNTAVRIDVSTPNGVGNPFYRKRYSGKVPVFTLHWKDDPRKNDAWAAEIKTRKGSVVFASQFDLDYAASKEGVTIPGIWVRAAIEFPYPQRSSKCIAGVDIGEEGADLSVFLPRWGPVVGPPVHWGCSNTTQTAWRIRDEAWAVGAQEVDYDEPGPGLGVKGTFNSSEKPLGFLAKPINTGVPPTESIWPDGETSQEKFLNLKAELWWLVRCRFERTYEYVTKQNESHKPEEMISIPNHPQLIQELSIPLHSRTDKGKIKIESKEDLRRRGVKSPDFAEALVLSEAAYAVKKQQFFLRFAGETFRF